MTNFLYYLAAFAVVLGVLIVVHEYGHYCVARWVGVKVVRFSIGFGRTVWSKRFGKDRTEWAISMVPLGGYVKMLDEHEGVVPANEVHRAFNRQSVWRRMAIVVAGPAANLVLAIIVYWALFWHGIEEPKAILGTPPAASAAAAAGFENGEQVLKVGGEAVQTWQDMRWVLLSHAVEQDVVELEVINPRNEISVRRVDVASARADGWEGDVLAKLGFRFYRPKIPPVLGKINAGSAAERGGLRADDEIVRIGEQPVKNWQDVVQAVRGSPGKSLVFEIRRDGRNYLATVMPDTVVEGDRQIGRIGATVRESRTARKDLMVKVRYGPVTAFGKAVEETWDKSTFSLVMIGKMITGEVSWRNISGPITIADYAGQSAKLGVDYYLKFLALISISLAVLNLLPIPVLDGGHLLYYVAELIRRKPLSERSMEIGQQIGIALLVILMACSFYNDINRLVSG
jgi:regulator of sigma E protease